MVNFNPAALDASHEILLWERLRMNIPYPALELNAQCDRHHVMRVNMASLVTLYNKVRNILRST
jgi:Dynein heavy chain, N-terminal region 1